MAVQAVAQDAAVGDVVTGIDVHPSTVINTLLALAVLAMFVRRRLTWQPVTTTEVWGTPVTLLLIGALQLRHHADLGGVDLALVSGGTLVSLAAGALTGYLTSLRRFDGVLCQRVGFLGLAVWVGSFLLRAGLSVAGHAVGATVTSGGPAMLVAMGANLLAVTVVLNARSGHGSQTGDGPIT